MLYKNAPRSNSFRPVACLYLATKILRKLDAQAKKTKSYVKRPPERRFLASVYKTCEEGAGNFHYR